MPPPPPLERPLALLTVPHRATVYCVLRVLRRARRRLPRGPRRAGAGTRPRLCPLLTSGHFARLRRERNGRRPRRFRPVRQPHQARVPCRGRRVP
eukprot:5300993-Pyramimonas_sp.AAC.1